MASSGASFLRCYNSFHVTRLRATITSLHSATSSASSRRFSTTANTTGKLKLSSRTNLLTSHRLYRNPAHSAMAVDPVDTARAFSTGVQVNTTQSGVFSQGVAKAGFVNLALGQPSPRLLSLPDLGSAFQARFGKAATEASNSGKGEFDGNGDFDIIKDELDPTILQYGTMAGYTSFRNSLSNWLGEQLGMDIGIDELMVSGGNSMAIQFCLRNLMTNGDTIVMDDPTYFLVGDVVKKTGLKVKLISSSSTTGFNADELEEWLRSGDPEERKISAVYLIPIHQNPTGASIQKDQAQKLVSLSREFDFYVIADEPYCMLNHRYDSREREMGKANRSLEISSNNEATYWDTPNSQGVLPVPCIKSFEASSSGLKSGLTKVSRTSSSGDPPSKVISLGTFSKILAPGLRLGWIHASKEVISQLVQDPVLQSGGCVNPVVTGLVHGYIESGILSRTIDHLNDTFSERSAAFFGELRKEFGSANDAEPEKAIGAVHPHTAPLTIEKVGPLEYCEPRGGYFGWIRFTDGTEAEELRNFLLENKDTYNVGFMHGGRCVAEESGEFSGDSSADSSKVEDRFAGNIRISWAFYEKEELREGVRRLKVGWEAFKKK